MEKVKGDIFIVPNGIINSNGKYGYFDSDGNEKPYHGKMVHVWITGSGSDDWGSHGFPKVIADIAGDEGASIDMRWKYLAPTYLPVSLFEGKVDGDIVTVNFHGIETELTIAQGKYRYARFGCFEGVLGMLLNEYDKRQAA